MSIPTNNAFTFDGYTVRPINEGDRDYLEVLIECDDYHRGRMTPDFFLKLQPGEDAWALEDDKGHIVFYFKTSTAVRMAIQFRPTESRQDKRRNQHALLKGLRWIEGIFRANNFREIIFDTEGPELAAFGKRHLGFTETVLLSKMMGNVLAPAKYQPRDLGKVPTKGLEVVR